MGRNPSSPTDAATHGADAYGCRNRGGVSDGAVQHHQQAIVKMWHLLEASKAAAARPGVTAEMVAGYERFAAGV